MANKTVYPYGTDGQLPSSIGIINDLETGGSDKALAAEQGKVLGEYVFGTYTEVDISELTISAYGLGAASSSSNRWTANGQHSLLPVNPGEKYKLTVNAPTADGSFYGFVTSSFVEPTSTSSSNYYVSGTARVWLANGSVTITVPFGAAYLIFCPRDGYSNVSTWTIKLLNESELNEEIDDRISEQTGGLQNEIDTLRGTFQEEVDFAELEVKSNGTSAITITKDENGGILVNNISSTGQKYALIGLPSSLVIGRKYTLSFNLSASFTKSSTWWLIFVDSSYNQTSGGIALSSGANQSYSLKFTYKAGDAYLRLASSSQNDGAMAYFTNFSISNITSVAELATKVQELADEDSGISGMDEIITQARYVAASPTAQSLALLHFTDIHGDTTAAKQILEFYNKYSAKIDDMVNTGDSAYMYYDDDGMGYQWYQSVGIADALFVLGNHDGASNDNSKGWIEGAANWDYKGKEWDFDTYFANYITSRGVTPPAGYDDSTSPYYKACYWHKDYTSAKVRVIGLDCMHFNDGVRYTSNDQETWLAAKLQETLTSGNSAYGFSVVFLCHYPLDDYSGNNETWDETTHKFVYNQNATGGHIMDGRTNDMVNCHYGTSFEAEARFSMRNRIGTVGSKNYTKGNDNPIGDIIQTWVNNGGKYIVWLSGHTHTEYMYYSAKYPGLLIMGLPQAGNTRGNIAADRSTTSAMHPCANLLVVDTQRTKLKIIRFGKTMDRDLMEFKYMTYDYSAKTVWR